MPTLSTRFAAPDAERLATDLEAEGWARLPALLSPAQCLGLRALYPQRALFRKQVVMQRHGYGRGEYSYFDYPLPPLVAALRDGLYPPLADVANRWQERLGQPSRFPAVHADYRAHCHAAGQLRPTPLLLRYGAGDYNHLHQDLYGDEVFPLQVAVLLSAPGTEFSGGEFVLIEQRPRQQSRVAVVPLEQGDAVVFAVNQRPVAGRHRAHRVRMRHGVSRIAEGQRLTLGIIFHDAR